MPVASAMLLRRDCLRNVPAGGHDSVRQRFRSWWFDLQSTLWFIPSIMTTMATVLAFALLWLDQRVLAQHEIQTWWLFEGGAEGARGVLSTIAGTMITVATTAFSITIVALQLGSSQFSPRILKGFTSDRGNQLVLGIFISTFAYTVVILRSVRSELADQDAFVPSISITLAILLAFTAIGSLIFFFHHATRTIQASVVIERAAQDTFTLIETRLTQGRDHDGDGVTAVVPRDDLVDMAAGTSGYLTSIDTGALVKTAGKHGLMLTIATQVGAHLLSTTPVASVPAASLREMTPDDLEALEHSVRRAFAVELERTVEHDLLLGFRQLSDIAIKALSPGINDPTTAVTAIDRMGEALLRGRDLRSETWFLPAPNGQAGIRQTAVGLDQMLDQCLPQIRHYGAADVIVITHLLRVLGEVANASASDARNLLANHAQLILDSAVQALTLSADRQRVQDAAAWAAADGAN